MKPKEFDELIRQKFDQNDFEYNPRNWDRLEEELEGRAKKRSVIMWWWMPIAGVAASVALAIGIVPLLRQAGPDKTVATTELVQRHIFVQPQTLQTEPMVAQAVISTKDDLHNYTKVTSKKHRNATVVTGNKNTGELVEIKFHEVAGSTEVTPVNSVNLLTIGNIPSKDKPKDKKKQVAVNEDVNTFIQEESVKKTPKLSVILSGGINRGSQNNGYMAGATIRRMVNDKVFVEGDIAFSNSSNTQPRQDIVSSGNSGQGARHNAAKTESSESNKITSVPAPPAGVITVVNVAYNLQYAQVTPSIGYKLMKRMSVAVGPDFQQVLVDNRPPLSTVDRGTLQEAAMFDVGFIGKTEYSITKNVKAAVSYRKGVNTLITLTDKYFDRDYLQFQVKCAIFNK